MTSAPLILAVDDEPGILRLIEIELREQGFRVMTTSVPAEVYELVEEHRPDLVLLDIMMPGIDGLEVMRTLHQRQSTPVVVVSAKDQDADKVRGLESGADDYIVKPFSPDELGARVRAVLRRDAGVRGPERIVRSGDVEVDLESRTVAKGNRVVDVTRTEWQLLQHLAANANKVLLSSELLAKVWGPEYVDDLQYLRVWISRLREKLEDDRSQPKIIQTRPGIGYVFLADDGGSS
ncbi:MAG: response regulator transcription factor [Dehalococcoidia bacterium]